METIYYLSDIKWFNRKAGNYSSKQHALKSHLDYIVKSKDFSLGIGDRDYILERSYLADKRINSRIACSFVFALPNNLENVKDFIFEIRKMIAEFNNMDDKDIFIGFHNSTGISGEQNKHLHVVLVNLDKNGKGIRLGRDRNAITEFHKLMQEFLIKKGYTIRKEQEQKHIGTRLRYDEELKNSYLEFLETKKNYRETLRQVEEKERKKEEQKEKAITIEELRQKLEELKQKHKQEQKTEEKDKKEESFMEIVKLIRERTQDMNSRNDNDDEREKRKNNNFRPKM